MMKLHITSPGTVHKLRVITDIFLIILLAKLYLFISLSRRMTAALQKHVMQFTVVLDDACYPAFVTVRSGLFQCDFEVEIRPSSAVSQHSSTSQ